MAPGLCYHTRRRFYTAPLIAELQAGKLNTKLIFIDLLFGLTRPGIEPESTESVADALFTRPLIVNNCIKFSDNLVLHE